MGALLGLNIYRLPHGTTVLNAINGNNGASKWSYSPTEGQDSEIHIRPQATRPWNYGTLSWYWDGYRLKVSNIFNEMDAERSCLLIATGHRGNNVHYKI
jgi:hypothetical protein